MKTLPENQPSLWRRLLAVGAVALVALAAGLADEAPPGKRLYDTRCVKCHKHHDITVYENMAWKRLLWKMKDKARLDNEEYGDLSDYLRGVRETARSGAPR